MAQALPEPTYEQDFVAWYAPSLQNHLIQSFDGSWQYALSDLRANYPTVQLPDLWPFSREIHALPNQTFWQANFWQAN